MNFNSFKPVTAGSVTITAGTGSAATALPAGGRTRVVVYNAGDSVVFIEFGLSGATAAVATGYPVGPGMKETLSIDSSATHIATISGAASQTFYVSCGSGE